MKIVIIMILMIIIRLIIIIIVIFLSYKEKRRQTVEATTVRPSGRVTVVSHAAVQPAEFVA